MERQIIIKGVAQKVSEETSDAYFYSRPIGSQIGAIVSPQSQPIERSCSAPEFQVQYEQEEIKRPDYWGGF